MDEPRPSFVAECFWTGVTDGDVSALETRILSAVAEVSSASERLTYSGSLLLPTDEVVLFLFQGSADLVRLAAQRAGVPFDRIVPTTQHALISPLGGNAT